VEKDDRDGSALVLGYKLSERDKVLAPDFTEEFRIIGDGGFR
jgi:hypothetical protein